LIFPDVKEKSLRIPDFIYFSRGGVDTLIYIYKTSEGQQRIFSNLGNLAIRDRSSARARDTAEGITWQAPGAKNTLGGGCIAANFAIV